MSAHGCRLEPLNDGPAARLRSVGQPSGRTPSRYGSPRSAHRGDNVREWDPREKGDVAMTHNWSGKAGRCHTGSLRYSMMSRDSMDSISSYPQFADVEEEFLHAAEFGDTANAKRLLKDCADLNVDCIDALGRTALRLAVKNEHLEIVETLLERSDQHQIHEAVLQAISAGHTQIAETILKHRRYLENCKEIRKMGDMDGFYKTAFPDSQFSPDITPLILAAQKNQYEIVQLLLQRGETIMKPHKFSCVCQECRNKMKFDQLRLAKYRLNAYTGLASEAYICLSSKDPILTAFELAAELRRMAKVEKHFKREYRDLADQLSDYVVKLLDRIRTQKELELVLNKTGKPHQEKFESLARFKLALNYKEKKFVAHASCQQRVVRAWYSRIGTVERAGWSKRIPMLLLFVVSYPVLVFLHIFYPESKGARILQFPVIKFSCHAISLLTLLLLIVVSTIESSHSVSKSRTLRSEYSRVHNNSYLKLRRECNYELFGDDFPLRPSSPSVTDILITLWIIGLVYQECNQIFTNGILEHLSIYNFLDFTLLSAYIATISLRYWTMLKFHDALDTLRKTPVTCNDVKQVYWLNTDRLRWSQDDPINVLEGLFAIANIISFFRISYLLPANEILGPLQISLGRMIKDIAKFGALFVLVIFAFLVGLHNLFWYYSERTHIELNYTEHPQNVNASVHFGGVFATFRTIFWSLFGRGDQSAVKLGQYDNFFTENIGLIIYGGYNVAMVTVLLNMLIAMMTRSFTLIAEDSDREWKFSRSLLYMEYISPGATLPAPLNLLGLPKAVYQFLPSTCCRDVEEQTTCSPDDSDSTSVSCRYLNVRQRSREEFTGRYDRTSQAFEESCIDDSQDVTPTKVRFSTSTMEMKEEDLTYQQTMERIVQRYIFDIQREAEVTEDDFEEIKQDMSSFRFELINQMSNRTTSRTELKNNMSSIMQQLQNLKDELGTKTKKCQS